MTDFYKTHAPSLTAPAIDAFAVSASDTQDLPFVTRGLYLATGGDVTLLLQGGDTPVTFANLSAGILHPLRVKRVYATGLSAGGLVGVY